MKYPSEAHEHHLANIEGMRALVRGVGPDEHEERERLLWLLCGIHAGALTPRSEDEKRGMERVLAILERKLGEGGGVGGGGRRAEQHNAFYRARWTAFCECAMMLRSALAAEQQYVATARREGATRRRDDIRRNERRRCVAYIHAYANGMNDPSARAALNTCADGLGKSALPLENEPGDAG